MTPPALDGMLFSTPYANPAIYTCKQSLTGLEPVFVTKTSASELDLNQSTLRWADSDCRPQANETCELPLLHSAILGQISCPCRYLFIREFAERLNALSWLRLIISSQTHEAFDIYKKD